MDALDCSASSPIDRVTPVAAFLRMGGHPAEDDLAEAGCRRRDGRDYRLEADNDNRETDRNGTDAERELAV